MVSQSIILIVACVSLIITIGAALVLQFGSKSHSRPQPMLITALTIAVVALTVAGYQALDMPPEEQEPWIVRLVKSM